MAECSVCTGPTGDDARLCRIHTDDLTSELAAVPELVDELDVTITRQARTTAERNGSRSTTTPLPWNEHASAKRSELWSTLGAWALDVSKLGEDERDRLADVDTYDTAGVARWLVRNMSTLRQHEEAGTAHDELIDAVRQGRRAIDKAPDRVFAGPCGADIEDQPGVVCTEDLYGFPGKEWISCACSARHRMSERREWMLTQIEDLAAHSGDLAALLTSQGVPIGSSTIRKWATAKENPLKVVSIDGRGRKFYRIGDVLDLVFKRNSPDGIDARTTAKSA